MTFQPRIAADPALADAGRRSVRVRRVMDYLDLDDSQVRRLVRDGHLEAHVVGKRGVRIYWDSVLAYQQDGTRRALPAPAPSQTAAPAASRRQAQTSAAHREALAALRAAGIS